MDVEAGDLPRAAWETTFRWLAAHELGSATAVEVPGDDQFLRERTKTLALLWNLLARSEIDGLPQIIAAWNQQFGPEHSVPLPQLRRVAREVLSKTVEKTDVDELWQRAVMLSHSGSHPASNLPPPIMNKDLPENRQRCCAEGLLLWFRELQSNPLWNTLPGIIPGEADRPLADVYVELFAVEEADVVQQDGMEASRRSWQGPGTTAPAINVESMIARTLERCVVVGDPGSGKSTLMKWLVWATFRGRLPDFDVAVEVKLSAFAAALALDATLRPLEYFFRSLGQGAEEADAAAIALREAAEGSQRYLLLLDGWDEVPMTQRAAVKECLLREERGWVTLITSRPSGMPRQLVTGHRVGCYRIAGLTPLMAENLTGKLLRQLGHSTRIAAIWARIRDDLHLRDMAANPFLLGLLVRTLIESEGDGWGTRAAVYRRITAALRTQYEMIGDRTAPLTPSHLDGLAQLSFQLLNDPHTPRYLFTRRELESHLPGAEAEPILRSRFVTKPVSVLDEFVVLHATIQEYLAAEHLAHGRSEDQCEFMERAFVSVSRLIVLEFLAGLGGNAASLCEAAAARWWQTRDRFLQVPIRIARLAAAGRWPLNDLGRELRETLWSEIAKDKDEDLALCQLAVQAYVELDVYDLIRRVRQHPPSSFALNCLIESIPAGIARDERLDQLLSGEWRDVAGLDWMGGATDAERAQFHHALRNWSVPAEDLREVVLQVGGSGDESAIPALVRMVVSEELPDRVREEAVTSIGRIGGLLAVHALIDILLNPAIPKAMAQMAAMAFVLRSSQRLRLDPRGRDRLLRRLAAIPPTDPQVTNLLTVLENLTIRDGAEVIMELATSPDVNRELNHQAIVVLRLVADRRKLENLVQGIDRQPPELTMAWLELAWERSLPIAVPWLMNRVRRGRSDLEQERLLRVLLQVLSQSPFAVQAEAFVFLDLLAAQALTTEESELARVLVLAVNDVSPRRVVLFSPKVRWMAEQALERALHEQELANKQQLLFAVALVRHFRETGAVNTLRGLLERTYVPGKSVDDNLDYQLFYDVGDCLAELAPRELLRLPAECPGVKWALRSRTLKAGWLVYSNRILNADGQEIGTVQEEITSLTANVAVEPTADTIAQPALSLRVEMLLEKADQEHAEWMKAIFISFGVPLVEVKDIIDLLYSRSRARIEQEKHRFYFRVSLFRELLIAMQSKAPKMPKGLTRWPKFFEFLTSRRSQFRQWSDPPNESPDESLSREDLKRAADALLHEPRLVELVFGSPRIQERAKTFERYARRWSHGTYGEVVNEVRQKFPTSYSVGDIARFQNTGKRHNGTPLLDS